MARSLRSLSQLAILILTLLAAAFAQEKPAASPVRILFIGNSYTYYNNLPEILTQIGASDRPATAIETRFVGRGGLTLQDQWNEGAALAAIREGHWDFVVLQEQSLLDNGITPDGALAHPDPYALFFLFARDFDAEIRKRGARTVLFSTWPHEDQQKAGPVINAAYGQLGAELGAIVAPVGSALQYVYKHSQLKLYLADKSHPSSAGSYLAACTFYAALFGHIPKHPSVRVEGYPYLADGTHLERSQKVVLSSLAPWDAESLCKAGLGAVTGE